ncbi:MAG: 4Fe-4S ferredoxin [Desulfobacteraceae bacterium 4572_87]|nr:MAG: 4Fe-4S ferredoxin [Desulfobacteraceae bacterium 4572_87]
MSEDIFRQLQEQLDQYSVGFPATESGVEMEILKRLFNEEEADMYLHMSMMLETPESVAGRLKQEPAQVALRLEEMAEKGLLFRVRKGDEAKYGAAPFVVGIYEYQLKTMDAGMARLFEDYFEDAVTQQLFQHVVPMRTVPVNKSIGVSWNVAPYEDAREIVKSKDRLAVANCICRVQQGLLEHHCEKPMEVCFMAGSHGEYYVGRGMGRWVSQEEALEILNKCEEAGLVCQPFNTVNPGGMCNCCGDCCNQLRTLKKHPRPAEMVVTNHYAVVDDDLCVGCEICLDRCQIDAITMGDDGTALVDLDRCIGCGLCVTTCDTEAMTLAPKSPEDRREPPAKAQLMMMELAQKRGKSLIPLAVMKGA